MKADFVGEIAGHTFTKPKQKKIDGVRIGEVITSCDTAMQGRVQLRLACAPDLTPWAAVASPMAGFGHGWFSMPQVGDQVVVAFADGDVTEPYIVGALWNSIKRPPIVLPTEAMNKRILRTPAGHQIEFDDATQALKITSSSLQEVNMDPSSVKLTAGLGAASIQISTDGSVSINAASHLELNATSIALNAKTNVDVNAGTAASLNGGSTCSIKGGTVAIN